MPLANWLRAGHVKVARDEDIAAKNSKSETFLDPYRDEVLFEVLVVFRADKHFDIHAVEDRRTILERTC